MLNLQLIILFFRLIVPILVIGSVVWFVWKSNKLGKNSLQWGMLAAAAYLLPSMRIIAKSPAKGVGFNFLGAKLAWRVANLTPCFHLRLTVA